MSSYFKKFDELYAKDKHFILHGFKAANLMEAVALGVWAKERGIY